MFENCCVPVCKSIRGKTANISFHEFPCSELRNEWIRNICRVESKRSTEYWQPSDRSYVCSRHFLESDYKAGCKVKRLKPIAVPTIFEDFPSYLQNKVKSAGKKRPKPKTRGELQPPKKLSKVTEFPESWSESMVTSPPPRESSLTEPTVLQNKENLNLSLSKTGISYKKTVWGKQVSPTKSHAKLRSYSSRITKLESKIAKLTKDNSILQQRLKQVNTEGVPKVRAAAKLGKKAAQILMEQIKNYNKIKPRWSEFMIRQCILWRSKSPRGYNYAHKVGILHLPSPTTLRKYLGPTSFQIGITQLIKSRLEEEFKRLSPPERFVSIIFDEMSAKPMCNQKRVDKQIGRVSFGGIIKESTSTLANRLLCFLMKGLSTDFRIPVGYFLVRQLTGEQLQKLMKAIILEVEKIGFTVVRLVGDDGKVNQCAFRLFSGGNNVLPEIPHPFRKDSPLILSYDPSHVIKNIRNNLISRDMLNRDRRINGRFLELLQNEQEDLIIKPVRVLTRKMLNPSNFEKMNVKRAIQLFAPPVTSALKLLKKNGKEDFSEVDGTVDFMETMWKWWQLHDVSDRTEHARSKICNKEHFWSINDNRLRWLEIDFINYLDNWKKALYEKRSKKKQKQTIEMFKSPEYLTPDTDKAIRITTISTIRCIRYLLKVGFQFVLTRKFSSDDIEFMFSGLRQFSGYNDQTNAVNAITSIETVLKMGIISASPSCNISTNKIEDNVFSKCIFNVTKPRENERNHWDFPVMMKTEARKLRSPPDVEECSMKVAGVSMVAGFCCRILKEKNICEQALDKLIDKERDSRFGSFIQMQDRSSGLFYPSNQFLSLVVAIIQFLNDWMDKIKNMENQTSKLTALLLPHVRNSSIIECGCTDKVHSFRMLSTIIPKVLQIYLANYSAWETEKEDSGPQLNFKPSCRKVLKMY